MKKLLIIQNLIPHYRNNVFNEISKHYDLTVLYTDGNEPKNVNFKFKKIKYIRVPRVGKIALINLKKLINQYDAIISNIGLGIFSLHKIIKETKKPYILWGIGVSASYNCRYDSDNKFFIKLIKAAKEVDACLFYSDYPVKKYIKSGVPQDKLFVANNTVTVLPIEKTEKNIFLFVGTLYKQKKIDTLLEEYYEAYKTNEDIYPLVIIGDGPEKENIKNWIDGAGLNKKIQLVGEITKEEEISFYFAKALLCLSPDQAGLSVLKSMGYGVPFVTCKDAITGGEIFNIENGKNGYLIKDFTQIRTVLLDAMEDEQKIILMGEKAKDYYYQNRTVDKMVKGFVDSVEYALKKGENG